MDMNALNDYGWVHISGFIKIRRIEIAFLRSMLLVMKIAKVIQDKIPPDKMPPYRRTNFKYGHDVMTLKVRRSTWRCVTNIHRVQKKTIYIILYITFRN